MATSYKLLGQKQPQGSSEDLYSTPSGTSTIVSTLSITNTGSTAASAHVYLRRLGDGRNWQQSSLTGVISQGYSVTYSSTHSLFVVGGNSGVLATSTDAITWTTRAANLSTAIVFALTQGNGLFVASGSSGLLSTSTDGITWTSRNSAIGSFNLTALTYGNGVYVVGGAGGRLATSTDGVTWSTRLANVGSNNITALTYASGIYVAGSATVGAISTSTDAITWTSQTSAIANFAINAITYGNGLFVAAAASGRLATSTDGVTWTTRASGTTANLTALAYGNGLFVAAGSNAVITSTDAITWTTRTPGAIVPSALTYGDGKFVMQGLVNPAGTNTAFYSSDGAFPASINNQLVSSYSIPANDTVALTLGLVLEEYSVLTVNSSTPGSLTFHAFGSEII